MCTAITSFASLEDVRKYHNVKVAIGKNQQALYFSRSIIPFDRNAQINEITPNLDMYSKHLGLYAYKREFLLEYVNMTQTPLEISESLEQLRILEN
jgi:3-deoxy-manno-octulosonate cytidylyltransferase (CMP-KDO synthetase)